MASRSFLLPGEAVHNRLFSRFVEMYMQLELATVISCGPSGCLVTPLAAGPAFETRYSALVQDRVKIRPGQLVAVDMQPEVPEVAWRWYQARVVDPDDTLVIVQERERQLAAAQVPGLETDSSAGDFLWITGMDGVWELHDRVVEGKPAQPSRLREKVFPRIEALLSQSGQTS